MVAPRLTAEELSTVLQGETKILASWSGEVHLRVPEKFDPRYPNRFRSGPPGARLSTLDKA